MPAQIAAFLAGLDIRECRTGQLASRQVRLGDGPAENGGVDEVRPVAGDAVDIAEAGASEPVMRLKGVPVLKRITESACQRPRRDAVAGLDEQGVGRVKAAESAHVTGDIELSLTAEPEAIDVVGGVGAVAAEVDGVAEPRGVLHAEAVAVARGDGGAEGVEGATGGVHDAAELAHDLDGAAGIDGLPSRAWARF